MAKAKKTAATKAATKEKLSGELIERLAKVGIKETDEGKARKKMLAFLEEKEVVGVDEDSTEELLVYVESMYEEDEEELEDEEEVDEEEVEDIEEEEDEEDEEDEEEDEEEEPEPPVKKKTSKKKPVIVESEEDEEEDEEMDSLVAEVVKKSPAKKKAGSKKSSSGTKKRLAGDRWETLKETDKEQLVKPFRKFFPSGKFNIDFITKGFVVRLQGASAEQNILKSNRVRRLDNGKIEGSFSTYKLQSIDELEEYVSNAVKDVSTKKIKKGDGSSFYVHPMSQDEMIAILKDSDFIEVCLERASKHDAKMVKNRQKLEAQIKETKKVAPVKKSKKPVVVEIEDEEEEPVVAKKKVESKKAKVKKGTKKAKK